MAIRDALYNDAYDLVNHLGVIEETDLTVTGWNRSTIADGQWLNDHAIQPLSARDVYLADQIDDANTKIDNITFVLKDLGVISDGTGASGGSLAGGSIKSTNYKVFNTYDDYASGWQELQTQLVPTGITDSISPALSLTYMLPSNSSLQLGDLKNTLINGRTCIIQGNCNSGAANQLLLGGNGVYYRSYSGGQPISQQSYYYIADEVSFKKLAFADEVIASAAPNGGLSAGPNGILLDMNNMENGKYIITKSDNKITYEKYVDPAASKEYEFTAYSGSEPVTAKYTVTGLLQQIISDMYDIVDNDDNKNT